MNAMSDPASVPNAALPEQALPAPESPDSFWPDTLTTWVDAMAGGDAARRHKALSDITQRYRRPVIRRIMADTPGLSPHDAEDLCHQFFLEKLLTGGGLLQTYQKERGRLRDYLAAALQHFLVSTHRKRTAKKRGGDCHHVPLEDWDGSGDSTADRTRQDVSFDREWALHIFAGAFRELERRWLKKPDMASRYAAMRPYLLGEASDQRQAELAAELGLSPDTFRQALRRLRLDWRICLCSTIAPTVASPAEVEDELRYLCEVLRQ